MKDAGMQNQRNATVESGVYCAMGGDVRLAERNQFSRRDLTAFGRTIYAEAVAAYDRTADAERLRQDVALAVDAGYE